MYTRHYRCIFPADIESRRQLADALQNLPASESIYLLSTFANMATSRPLEEDDFIECITLQVFEVRLLVVFRMLSVTLHVN